MAKSKTKKKVYEPVFEQITNKDGETQAMVRMVEKRYYMLPVDFGTRDELLELCALRGMGQRGQGAMVRILVKEALAKTKADLEKLK